MSMAMANMGSMPIRYEAKQLPLPYGDVLYLGFNMFLPDVMSQLRESIKERSDDVVGLIVDLRGNPGGIGLMASGLAGLLTEEQYSLGQMTMRSGQINFIAFPQQDAFLGPIAVLVDGMSASTSEIFAAGLQEAGRARVFGRPTMGAALPSFIRQLPNGDRLQHAIADMRTTKGRRVEGRGVIPDKRVRLQPAKLFAGQDPVLDKAMQWLQRQTNANTP
jgi:carboxyl-terminal processing protease